MFDYDYKLLRDTYAYEEYTPRVTMSMPEWRQYVASGRNTLYGSGGVIPSGTLQTGFGGSGAVYRGHVRQGW